MSLFKRLLGGCWWTHTSLHRERLKGQYVLRCQACGTSIPILKGQKFRERKTGKVVSMRSALRSRRSQQAGSIERVRRA